LSALDRWAQKVESRQAGRFWGAAGVAGLLVAASVLLMMLHDGTAGGVVPVALLGVFVMLRWPWALYAATLAQFSIFPVENYLYGFWIPNLNQFLIPALMLALLAHAAMHRDWGTFRIRAGDVFVAAFMLVAVLGIAIEPGYKNWKTFGNQVLFAIFLYFASRWVRLDRQRFRLVLKVICVTAAIMLADLALVQLTRLGRLWTGAGPLGSLSDQATYSALFPPFFLYLAATASEDGKRGRAKWWLIAALVGVVAAAGVKERSGVVAGLLGLFVCIAHPKMFKYVAIGVLVLIPVGAWWLSTSLGSEVHSRFADDKDPMLRRRIYVGKAVDYIRSDKWNPIWGTGFWRLKSLSNEMLSPTELVWDANKQMWRRSYDLGQRPIHCAPVRVFGEFGYAGVFCLLGIAACVGFSVLSAWRRARRRGRAFDSVFLVALAGSAAGLMVNAGFHNTTEVFPVTAYFWATVGLLVGHSDVLIVQRAETAEPREASDVAQSASG